MQSWIASLFLFDFHARLLLYAEDPRRHRRQIKMSCNWLWVNQQCIIDDWWLWLFFFLIEMGHKDLTSTYPISIRIMREAASHWTCVWLKHNRNFSIIPFQFILYLIDWISNQYNEYKYKLTIVNKNNEQNGKNRFSENRDDVVCCFVVSWFRGFVVSWWFMWISIFSFINFCFSYCW